MTETLTITGLGRRGEGIAETAGGRVYVPFTLPGEVVEAEVEGERGTLIAVREASPDRIAPESRYFGACGGCALQHMAPAAYAVFKRGLVITALEQARIAAPVADLVDARGNGRRRAVLHADRNGAGYMRARSHDLLDIDSCAILVPALREAAPRIARAIGAVAGRCDVAFTATDSGIDVTVRPERKASREALTRLAATLRLARLSLGDEVLFQQAPPTLTVGPAQVAIAPGSFLQATAAAEATLAGLVAEAVGKPKVIADLFCGIGPFALRLAAGARVTALDSDRSGIGALAQAVRHTRGLKPIEAKVRDLFRDPLAPVELRSFEAVVLDPPRAGAAAQAKELAASAVPTIVYVSCDPGSFARDAAVLIAGGYRLAQVTPVDQFAYSAHVELVGVFRR